MNDRELASLSGRGWFSRETFAESRAIAAAAQLSVDAHELSPASISRGHRADEDVRSDTTRWIANDEVAFLALTAVFEGLRREMNGEAWLGLTRFDMQLAHYAGGGERYVRHRDAFAGTHNRRLTAIAYLNASWVPAHGGELRLHGHPTRDVAPQLGRLVVFLSAKVEHEVLPVWAPRMAATAWYYAD